jgi:hypothetical protein
VRHELLCLAHVRLGTAFSSKIPLRPPSKLRPPLSALASGSHSFASSHTSPAASTSTRIPSLTHPVALQPPNRACLVCGSSLHLSLTCKASETDDPDEVLECEPGGSRLDTTQPVSHLVVNGRGRMAVAVKGVGYACTDWLFKGRCNNRSCAKGVHQCTLCSSPFHHPAACAYGIWNPHADVSPFAPLVPKTAAPRPQRFLCLRSAKSINPELDQEYSARTQVR